MQTTIYMKKSIVTFAFLLIGLFAASTLVMNCSGKKADQSEESGHHHAEGDSTMMQHEYMPMNSSMTTYACPMHPKITGKKGDTCSKCGMQLEAVSSNDSTEMHLQ